MIWESTKNEFIKIAAKPRSYLGLGAITILVAVILFAMKVDGLSFITFLTSSFDQTISFEGNILNGNLIGFIILQMLVIHIPLLVALVTGDLVSGEGAMGTIRMLLTKPVSRTTILLSKFFAGCFYTLVIILWFAFMAVVIAKVIFGDGDLMVLNSDGLVILQAPDVTWRFLSAFGLAFLSLITIATLSIMFSCFSENSVGPIVATMAVIILFTIVNALDAPVFDGIRPYLFTTHLAAWRSFFSDPLPIPEIINSVLVLVAHILVMLGISIYKFNKKDILS